MPDSNPGRIMGRLPCWLRKVLMKVGRITRITWKLVTMEHVVYCDRCGDLCYLESTDIYMGGLYFCPTCKDYI